MSATLWSARLIGIMIVGGMLVTARVAIRLNEIGIALSVVILGAVIALQVCYPTSAVMALVGSFAVFQGHAYRARMTET